MKHVPRACPQYYVPRRPRKDRMARFAAWAIFAVLFIFTFILVRT